MGEKLALLGHHGSLAHTNDYPTHSSLSSTLSNSVHPWKHFLCSAVKGPDPVLTSFTVRLKGYNSIQLLMFLNQQSILVIVCFSNSFLAVLNVIF